MQILLDGFYLNKPRGMGRYLQELLNCLVAIKNENPALKIKVLVPSRQPIECRLHTQDISYIVGPQLPFPIWEQLYLPHAVNRVPADVVHFPYNTAPLALLKRKNCVVTIHDLMYMDGGGGNIYQKLGNLYRKMVVATYKAKAGQTITLSHYYVEQIKKRLGIGADRIYTSVDYFFHGPSEIEVEKLNYFLHVGGVSPHKNTEGVLNAFLQLPKSDLKLLVLGLGEDSPIAKRYAGETIIFPGWVSDAQMRSLYRNAKAVVFPSFKEGYGLPIVEAFCLGVPVITSDVCPMNEIGGEAAILVDPYNQESIAEAMLRVISDRSWANDKGLQGLRRYSELMSAVAMGSAVLQSYNKAAN